jgi:hypothetical protein
LGYLCIVESKLPKVNNGPNGRKMAQSGHPAREEAKVSGFIRLIIVSICSEETFSPDRYEALSCDSSRVTRLGEISPIGRLFNLGIF